ncbi:hypothetical protein FGO68_gene4291 [Halteria grandinella]|uniref:Uncharacterized protein n=1 Tax=Halteria grandinella TaxID=5974 RepID=A0A8J8TAF2_HALGN|nr:hypothetical protein FGO68_gene4291 [Halteria grandinella]
MEENWNKVTKATESKRKGCIAGLRDCLIRKKIQSAQKKIQNDEFLKRHKILLEESKDESISSDSFDRFSEGENPSNQYNQNKRGCLHYLKSIFCASKNKLSINPKQSVLGYAGFHGPPQLIVALG